MGSPSASGPTGYSPWPSLSFRTCMPRPFPDCVMGLRTKMQGCTPLRRWTRCIFSSIRDRGYRRNRMHDVRAIAPEEEPQGTGDGSQGNSGSSEPNQGIGENPAGKGSLCSLIRLGILHPQGLRPKEGVPPHLLQMGRGRTLPAELPPYLRGQGDRKHGGWVGGETPRAE